MPINWSVYKYRINYFLLILIAFFLPLEKKIMAPLIILFFISSLFNYTRKSKQQISNYLIIITFYLTGVLSLLYGNNIDNTFFNLEIKLSLLVFPISFMISKIDLKKHFNSLLNSFLDGTLVAIMVNILIALIHYYYKNDISVFLYDNFSYFSHVSYYSFFLNFAICILYYFWLLTNNKSNYSKYFYPLLIIVYSFVVLMLSSKSGMISMISIHLIISSIWIFKYQKIKQGLLILGTLSIIASSTFYLFPQITNRVTSMIRTLGSRSEHSDNSTEFRVIIWKESYEIIKRKPFLGYGIGDVTDVLTSSYKEKGLKKLELKKYNSHNQFIQILISSGLLGMIVFITLLMVPLLRLKSMKNRTIYGLFLVLIIINFMTESMLETQSGVIFFAFFITIFYSMIDPKSSIINKV